LKSYRALKFYTKNMKSLLLSIVLFISTFGLAQTTELKLASDVWPPFTNIENENSFALDLVNEALGRIDVACTFEIVKWNEVIAGINAGIYDGSGAMWLDDDREEKYMFSSTYLQNQLILVGAKGSDVSASSFAELKGKRIGIVEDYAYGDSLLNSKEITLVEGKSDQQNLERLLSDKIDYMIVDALLIQYLLKYQVNDVSEHLSIAKTPILVKSLHLGLRKDIPGSEQILSRFNEEIKTMIADGSYNRILHLNWIQADMDGDGQLELILDGEQAGTQAPDDAYGVMVDQSFAYQSTMGSNRYYIDGQTYTGWDNVPEKYKSEIRGTDVANPADTGFKLNFDRD